MLMASYPKGRRPKRPFPYYNEVMTGFEYTAAVGMLYENRMENGLENELKEKGLEVISAIRQRYDGKKRSPFNEAECGNHYARAMASWGAVLALSGFQYSGVAKTMTFAGGSAGRNHFWSNGYSWGTCKISPKNNKTEIQLKVLFGSISLNSLEITGVGKHEFSESLTLSAGTETTVTL